MSFLDNGEERRGLILGKLVFSSELQSVVVQIQQYVIQVVLITAFDFENLCQLPTTSQYPHIIWLLLQRGTNKCCSLQGGPKNWTIIISL